MADINQYLEQLKDFDINNIDWDRIGVWPVPAKIFVCILAVAAILVGCHFLFVKERNATLERAQTQEQTLKSTFEKKAFQAANLDRYRQQMEEMQGTLQALVSRLPASVDMPDLLDDITEKIIEARLESKELEPLADRVAEFHVEKPVQIEVWGGYHEFGAFVSGIAGMPRIVTLHNFTINRRSGSAAQLSMEIEARTYFKPEEEE